MPGGRASGVVGHLPLHITGQIRPIYIVGGRDRGRTWESCPLGSWACSRLGRSVQSAGSTVGLPLSLRNVGDPIFYIVHRDLFVQFLSWVHGTDLLHHFCYLLYKIFYLFVHLGGSVDGRRKGSIVRAGG